MSLTTKLVSSMDMVLHSIRSGFYKNLKDYCFLETACSDTTMIAKDGSFVTVFAIHGSRMFVGGEEMSEMEEMLHSRLISIFKKEGHQLDFVFARDIDRVKTELARTVAPYRKAAKNLNLDLDDLFESKVNHLSKFCSFETTFVVAWSRPSLISEELKNEQDKARKNSEKSPRSVNAQNVFANYDALENKHNAFISHLEQTFNETKINFSVLELKRALRDIRKLMHNDFTAEDWNPVLVGDKIPQRDDKKLMWAQNDISDLMWPSISEQIFPDDVYVEDSNVVKIGDRYVSSMYADLPPQQTKPFRSFLNSVDRDIPFQLSISLEGGGVSKMGMKALAAALLSWTNSTNRLVKEAMNELRDMDLEGEAIVKMKINAITWANDIKKLNLRKQTLMRSMQSWGTMSVKLTNSDPVEGFLCAIPALTPLQSGVAATAPLQDIVGLLPLTRQSHVWESGAVTFRTFDGKIFPYQPGSSLQTTWNDLIFAIPGSGKSVLMNSNNLASIITPGAEEMPYVGIIDIGPSSEGLIQLIKDALPESQKHLAIYERIQNTHKYAINVFDTQLGFRFPTPADRMFLTNFLTLLMTPAGQDKPYASSENMAGAVIDAVYDYYSDENEPKKYIPNVAKKVDELLHGYGVDAQGEDMSWWEVVDKLFELGHKHEASQAQKFAVPLLEECVDVAQNSPSIKDLYSKPEVETRESMLEIFQRSISEAVNQFKILNSPTVFDLADSRVISLDLDEVAKSGGASASKQTGIMYMLARHVVGKNYKLSKEFANECPKLYRKYHLERAKKIRQTKKRLCMDEFHRTSTVPSVRDQVLTDMREGRKWNLQVVLASQIHTDFDDNMIDIATGTFIMSGGSSYKEVAKRFNLNATTTDIVKSYLNGPSKKGVPFVYNFVTTNGQYSQYLFSTISPVELWAFSTTAEDATLRSQLTEELGSAGKARSILASEFPGGSAKETIEKLVEATSDPSITKDPYTYLIRELKKKYDMITIGLD